MNNILFYLIIVVYTITALLILKKNSAIHLISPQMIFTVMYVISFLCCAANMDLWGVNFSLLTLAIYMVGLIIIVLVSTSIKTKYKKKIEQNNHKPILFSIPRWLLIIMLIYDIVVIALVYANVKNIALKYGSSSGLTDVLYTYKQHASYSHDEILNPAVRILKKIVLANGYLAIFALSSRFFSKKRKIIDVIKNNIVSTLLVAFVPVLFFLQSDRGSIVSFALSAIIIVSFFAAQSGVLVKKIIPKIAQLGLIMCIAAASAFYFVAPLIGRINELDFSKYVTMYLGGSIDLFDLSIKNRGSFGQSRYFGEHSFAYLYKDLDKMGVLDHNNTESITPTLYNGDAFIGNVYTAYHAWYYDFGIIGMVFMQTFFALVVSLFFYRALAAKRYIKKIALIFSYAYFAKWVLYHSVYGGFPAEFVCRAGILDFLFVLIMLLAVALYNKNKGEKRYE